MPERLKRMCCRSPANAISPPQYMDPTYRRPENAVAALQPPNALTGNLKTLERGDIQKSRLPENLKKKLLEEVCTFCATLGYINLKATADRGS